MYYEKYSDIPLDIRRVVMRKLGISAGVMREEAKLYNPKVIIAFHENIPVAWTTLSYRPSIHRGNNKEELNVFVSTKFRRIGIATKLIHLMSEYNPTVNKYLCFPYNDTSKKFFQTINKKKIKIINA